MKYLRALKMKHHITVKNDIQVDKMYSPTKSMFQSEKQGDSFGDNQDLIEENLFMKVWI